MFEMNTALVGLGAIAAFGLSATGSAIGCGLAAASAVGSWKRCYVQGKSAPFQLTIFAGAPMTQTIYGLILMLQVLTMDPVLWPAAIGIGFLCGTAIGFSAIYQGRAGAGACDAFSETGKGFANDLIALGVVETIAIFTMVFAMMFKSNLTAQLAATAASAL